MIEAKENERPDFLKSEREKNSERLQGIVFGLENMGKKPVEERQQLIADFFEILSKDFKIELTPEVGKLFQEISRKSEGILVRTERLAKITQTIAEHSPIELEFRGEKPYANAAVFGSSGEGVATAFSEGAPESLIKALIGFDSSELKVSSVPESECDLRDRSLCRSIEGKLNPDKVKYLVFRIPRSSFPVQYLTEKEKNNYEDLFVFRGTSLNL